MTTKLKQRPIDPDALSVILRSSADGALLRLPEEALDRTLYLKVNRALEAEGGKWDRKLKAHVFASAAADILARLRGGTYTDAKRDLGFFETPPAVAAKLIALAQIERGMTVLEPSAGRGALVKPALEAGGHVMALEVLGDNADALRKISNGQGLLAVLWTDFEAWAAARNMYGPNVMPLFDRVVMNPPFANRQDAKHVLLAWRLVKPGGRLVAIMSNAVTFRTEKEYVEVRELIAKAHGEIHLLPEGTFKEAGTNVNTVIVILSKRS